MKKLIWGMIGAGAIGLLLLALIDNPFVMVGYFGFYLLSTITIFYHYFGKLQQPVEIHEKSLIN